MSRIGIVRTGIRRADRAALALATILLLLAGARLVLPPDEPPETAPRHAEPEAAPVSPLPPLDRLRAVVARNLFVPGRVGSGSAAQTGTGAAGRAPPPLTLVGTVTSGGRRLALLRTRTGATRSVAEGASIAGWTLRSVGREEILLEGEAGMARLGMARRASPVTEPAIEP